MDIYTHPFWYVFMMAVLASMTAMVICYTLYAAVRSFLRRLQERLRGGGI